MSATLSPPYLGRQATESSPTPIFEHDYKSDTSTLTSGTVVHTWNAIKTPSQPRSKAILILQHGFSEYAERYVDAYNHLIPRLNNAGYDVWAMDMWGHGRSPGTRGSLDISRAVADHIEVRQRVARSMRDSSDVRRRPVFLFGHSLGGLVTAGSVVSASQDEKRSGGNDLDPLCGVVLTGPALASPELIASSRYLAGMIAAILPNLRLKYSKVEVEKACRGNSEEVARMLEDPMMFHGHISFRIAATALCASNDVWAGLADCWTMPTLVIHGTGDTYTDHKQSIRFCEKITSVDKTLHLIQDGYHESLNDIPGRDETLERILEWLDARTSRHGA